MERENGQLRRNCDRTTISSFHSCSSSAPPRDRDTGSTQRMHDPLRSGFHRSSHANRAVFPGVDSAEWEQPLRGDAPEAALVEVPSVAVAVGAWADRKTTV